MTRDPTNATDTRAGDALIEAITDLGCPRCTGHSWPNDRKTYGTLDCLECGHRIEMLPGLIRLRSDTAPSAGISQQLMRSRPVVSIYERAWRPAITWAASGLSYRDELAFLTEHVPNDPASRIVDWCCGTGLHGRTLAARLQKPGLVVGVDSSWPMAHTAAARARGTQRDRQVIVHGDIHDLKPRRPFTAGYCFAALHLLADKPKALAHMARSLTPGAPFLCFTLYRPDETLREGLGSRVGIRTESKDEILAMFSNAGLEVCDVRESGRAIMIRSRRI